MTTKRPGFLQILSPESFPARQDRILSVDALRGFDMFWITGGALIFTTLHEAVQSPVTAFFAEQLEHVEWKGFHFLDIIMPLFLFLTGVSMPLSFKKRLQKGSEKDLWKHIIKRVIILWILGMMVQGNLLTYDFSKFAFFSNTLQAIAAGFLISAIIILNCNVRQQFVITLLLMVLYSFLVYFVSIPGEGKAVIEPHQNLALHIDKWLLGKHQDGTNYTWILTSLNFAATVMTGIFASYILQAAIPSLRKLNLLFFTGAILLVAGLLLNVVDPIIKHIWTSSFVLFSSGLCFLLLSLFYLIVDYWNIKGWTTFFIVIGSNSILAYMVGDLFDLSGFAAVFLKSLQPGLGDWYPFFLSLGSYTCFWLLFYFLYKRKIFIRI
ncbi:MAG TPA: DUF5009 domain-containing protein [Agriterribacter sp.]|nr:DUF5009 domain-containing protein [Agriterribacter sp.]